MGTPTELERVALSGSERARRALAVLLDRPIAMTEVSVYVADEPDATLVDRIDRVDGSAVYGRLGISGPPDGAAWVEFDRDCVQMMLDSFDMGDRTIEDADARSMVAEVANIITGSYLTELGDAWGVALDPTPAQLDPEADVARADVEQARSAESASSLRLGCGFGDGDDELGMSVYLMLSKPRAATPAVPSTNGGR